MPQPTLHSALRRGPGNQTPRLFPNSKTMYWAAFSRAMSTILAITFIPMVAGPLGFTDLVIAMLGGVTISVLWDAFAVAHRASLRRPAPWPLLILFDLIIVPTMLLVFGASAYMDGIVPRRRSRQDDERSLMALVLFVLVSAFHLLSLCLDFKTTLREHRVTFTTPRSRSACTITKRRVIGLPADCEQARPAASRTRSALTLPGGPPEEAFTKQRAELPVRRMSRSEALPRYSAEDPSGSVPPYDLTLEC